METKTIGDSDLDNNNSDNEDQDKSESMFEDHAQILWTSLEETKIIVSLHDFLCKDKT
jgi:hypothetical protein